MTETMTRITIATRDKLNTIAKRWRETPYLNTITISQDRLISMAVAVLEKEIPWSEAETIEGCMKVANLMLLSCNPKVAK